MRGFSIVEVLVAMTVFTLALLFLLPLVPAGLHSHRQAMTRNLARELALAELEGVRDVPVVGSQRHRAGEFDVSLQVSPVAARLRECQVVVSWQERGESRSVLLKKRVCGVSF